MLEGDWGKADMDGGGRYSIRVTEGDMDKAGSRDRGTRRVEHL